MRLTRRLGSGHLPTQQDGCGLGGAPCYPDGDVSYGTRKHTNELVRLYAIGQGAELFRQYEADWYPCTRILDNTRIFYLLAASAGVPQGAPLRAVVDRPARCPPEDSSWRPAQEVSGLPAAPPLRAPPLCGRGKSSERRTSIDGVAAEGDAAGGADTCDAEWVGGAAEGPLVRCRLSSWRWHFSPIPAPRSDGSVWRATAHGEYQLGDCLAKRIAKRWFICTGSLGKNASRVSPHNAGASATIRTGTNLRENVGRLHAAHRALEVILALAGIEVLDG